MAVRSDQTIQLFLEETGMSRVANQKMGVSTYDPYDYMVEEWAPTEQHDLSVGLTTGKTSFNLGLGLLEQSGMLKPAKVDKFSRYNVSLKVSSELNKYVTLRAGAIYSRRNKEYAYITNSTTADPWLYLYRWSSLYPFGNDENGDPIRSPEVKQLQRTQLTSYKTIRTSVWVNSQYYK